ncbi:ArsR/SmtB family transcription factor [Roseospira marina]|uniref:ArsR/SmtB family transcription factor n=1 Tax=Roseospira marina TaxID=140057 RepID=UPI0016200BA6|nr:metalloregulator ArsR/SmtB family transcription factor [Roseospira marina]MBB4313356.1 DNA-binding transcriptional ArsR family regulator [Roseospira marina]MBB5085903.1 DNA-binding transcriptional ArsR family regulator [Roseospira marina]
MNMTDLHDHSARAAALLKALGNDRRLMLLCALVAGERTVGDLGAKAGLSQSALSQHLARLRRDGLVATRRVGQHIHYRIASPEVLAIIETLAHLYCPASAPPRPDPSPEPTAPAPARPPD